MKKILYTIGFLMFISAAISPLNALGAADNQFSGDPADVPYSAARLSSKLVAATGLNPAANWFEIFGTKDEENVGKDLYAEVYKKTQDEPEKKAFKNIAGKYGMPEADLVQILYGDYTKLLEKKPGMSQEEAMRKIAEIQQAAAEEKDLQQLQADIKAAVEPNEIFANGSLTDSGFDLINDLQIIENILFLKSDPIDVGGTFDPLAGGGTETPGGGTPPGGTPGGTGGGNPGGTVGVIVHLPAPTIGGTQETTQTGGTTQPVVGTEAPGASGSPAGETPAGEAKFNPLSCFEGTAIGKALQDFENKSRTDNNYKDNSKPVTPPVAPAPAPSPAAGAATGSTAGAGGASGNNGGQLTTGNAQQGLASTDFLPPKPDNTPPVTPAPADEWLKPKECTSVFCLFVNFVSAPVVSAYKNSDNCIACHAEKINDTLKKVINHSLIPAKAPGNLGEGGTCKKAMLGGFGSISMMIYATPMPVLTPTNDDLVFGPNIEDDWYNYCNLVAFPFSCAKKPPSTDPNATGYVITPSVADVVSEDVLTNAGQDTSLAQISRNIQTATAGYALEKSAALQKYDAASGADTSIGFYDPLKVELDQMNYSFASIRDVLHSLHADVATFPGSHACTELRDKKECE